jgi:hypothetical protein
MLQAVQAGLEATILFDNAGEEAGITPVGTTNFSYLGTNWTGGTVTATGTSPLASSGSSAYVFGAGGGQVTFDTPINTAMGSVGFYFVHADGQTPFTATAFDANNVVLRAVTSNLATQYNSPDNFEFFDTPAAPITASIARIEFSGGYIDNFFFRAAPVPLTYQIDDVNDTITVTPPTGFVGTMAILIGAWQDPTIHVDTVDHFDRQLIPIRVLPAGASAATAPPDEEAGDFSDDALDVVFDEIGAIY